MADLNNEVSIDENARKLALDRRFEGLGWAALLITLGVLWLMPENLVPRGSWLIAAGTIMLGLNAIRYAYGIRMSGFSLVVGTVALVLGLSGLFGMKLSLFPIVLIVIGVAVLLASLCEVSSMCSMRRWSCCGPSPDTMSQRQTQQPIGR